jgi:protein-S-isoprenylcysteine O-methyltransferase Ste14
VRIQPWDLVFLVGFVVYVIIRGVFEQRTKGNVKLVSRRDARELTLMVVLGVGTMLLPVLYLFTPWLGFADYRLAAWAPWCGTVLMSAALWLFWRSHADLGENWSIALECAEGIN